MNMMATNRQGQPNHFKTIMTPWKGFGHLVVVLVLLTVMNSVGVHAKTTTKKPKIVVKAKHLEMCHGKPSLKTRGDMQRLTWLLEASGEKTLLARNSPQHDAACWILHDDRVQSHGRNQVTFLERYALATLYLSTTFNNSTDWDWHMAADQPTAATVHGHWLSPRHHECSWYGVSCQRNIMMVWSPPTVIGLDLGFLSLKGVLPRELFLLPNLKQ
jgi:hypothetical protein